MKISIAAVALCLANVAIAQTPGTSSFTSSAKLGEACKADLNDPDTLMKCTWYVVAIHDTISTMRTMNIVKPDQLPYCLPQGVMQGHLIGAVKKYYAADPARITEGQQVYAPASVMMAFIKAFPCGKK